jgi:hypothetical protein
MSDFGELTEASWLLHGPSRTPRREKVGVTRCSGSAGGSKCGTKSSFTWGSVALSRQK